MLDPSTAWKLFKSMGFMSAQIVHGSVVTFTTPHQSLGPFGGFRKVMGMSWGLAPVIIHFLGFFHEIKHPSSWGSPCKVGINQTCGVDGCYCDVLSDLLCVEPPLPKQICVKARLRGWKSVGGSGGYVRPCPLGASWLYVGKSPFLMGKSTINHHLMGFQHDGVSENRLVPLNPMVLLIIIPF